MSRAHMEPNGGLGTRGLFTPQAAYWLYFIYPPILIFFSSGVWCSGWDGGTWELLAPGSPITLESRFSFVLIF